MSRGGSRDISSGRLYDNRI